MGTSNSKNGYINLKKWVHMGLETLVFKHLGAPPKKEEKDNKNN